MYTIHVTALHGYVISRDRDPANTLRVATLAELLRLRQRLNEFVDNQQPDNHADDLMATVGEIDTVEARAVATALNIRIPPSTIVAACERATIAGARKDRGRWKFQRYEFDKWLSAYRQHAT
jgi:hypothetical protein